ncbi:PDR/VanB family oxidoreductase [Arthrobacter mobilis]|uniref:Oxidoreductase n=1 Tax=Arthrobacter mobilis TaxID=2724944 RepID=A0A7X6K7I9_9MICC|nr:PDR/VanB family oxidoreductase [Arthrobacter mobilis]NKX56564.1 oxidoreductase [Arthrobacter mobilis]
MTTTTGAFTARKLGEFEGTLTVSCRTEASDGVVALELTPDDGTQLPAWEPGAHIDLVLGPRLVRQYSLCGDPGDRSRWRIGVLREPQSRGGSEYVHDRLMEGEQVQVRGPRNSFALKEADGYVFIAGGIGITPILPMVARAESSGVPWRLLYGGRTRNSMAFLDELEAYGDTVTVRPEDEFGLLDLATELRDAAPGTKIYCCGPGPLLDAVERASAHWAPDALNVERFKPLALAPGGAFTVELARSNLELNVPPERSILEVVNEAGIDVISSCESGICGTCITNVLEGTPDHKDDILSAGEREAGTCMTICVSRSLSPKLVLDL